MSNQLPELKSGSGAAYASPNPQLEHTLQEYSSAIYHNYLNADGRGTSMRHGLTYGDYSDFRPEAQIPRKHCDIMFVMDDIYNRVGLIKTIIDSMSDFVVQGIRISHPIPSTQQFYENWFARVNGVHVSERIANNLFKFGTSVVSRKWARLSNKVRKTIETSRAVDDCSFETVTSSGKVPCRYNFLNPAYVDVLGGELASFIYGPKQYGIRLPIKLINEINKIENKEIRKLLPREMIEAAKRGDSEYVQPLDVDNTIVLHYKKDDWCNWSKPLIYPILRDVFLLDKLQLADFTALDGAVDYVRVFKLGDLDKEIMPAEGAFDKLNELLHANNGAGVRNIVWGPDIQIEESKTDIYNFLGDDKYKPALNAIYAGLGIPPTLTGAGTETSGSTNNLVSIKTLIKRLDYVRSALVRFWMKEIAIVNKELGSRSSAQIEFEVANFGDEETEKRIWIDLVDRNIISHEWLQKRFGAHPSVEESRLMKEHRARKGKRRVPKGGPWHDPERDEKADVKMQELELQQETKLKQPAGRPDGANDTEPRKQRRFVPITRATQIWAAGIHDDISALVNPVILEKTGKNVMRALSASETLESERIKLVAFFGLPPMATVTKESVATAMKNKSAAQMYSRLMTEAGVVEGQLGRKMTFAEIRQLATSLYMETLV